MEYIDPLSMTFEPSYRVPQIDKRLVSGPTDMYADGVKRLHICACVPLAPQERHRNYAQYIWKKRNQI
jgi:hypothetical protein